jgi:hypothetical protein
VAWSLLFTQAGTSEVDDVEAVDALLHSKNASGASILPPGSSYRFSGSHGQQVRSAKTLKIVLPVALLIIFLILYLQFRSVITTGLVFSGVLVAWAGGFVLLWLYGQGWFLDFAVFGVNMRDLFNVHTVNLSVAVWVGFLALFGIATDDGVVMATYLGRRRATHPAEPDDLRHHDPGPDTRLDLDGTGSGRDAADGHPLRSAESCSSSSRCSWCPWATARSPSSGCAGWPKIRVRVPAGRPSGLEIPRIVVESFQEAAHGRALTGTPRHPGTRTFCRRS